MPRSRLAATLCALNRPDMEELEDQSQSAVQELISVILMELTFLTFTALFAWFEVHIVLFGWPRDSLTTLLPFLALVALDSYLSSGILVNGRGPRR